MGRPRSAIHSVFAARLRAARVERGMSSAELALMAGLDRSYVERLEEGERNPTLTILAELAEALGTTVAALVGAPHDGMPD